MAITGSDYLFAPPRDGLLGLTLPHLLTARAESTPDAVAATDGSRHRTWHEWRSDSESLVSGLQRRGVRPGDVVAVQVPNSWEFLTLHTAVAAAGAVLLPLHTAYGKAEVETLLGRVTPELFVDREVWARIRADGGGRTPRPVEVDPALPFLAVPSSGTTSAHPKICLHSQDGLLTNAAAVVADAAARESDVVLSASPFSHLFGLHALHVSLLAGARQALLPTWDAAAFAELATTTRTTVLYAVPAQLTDLLARRDTLPEVLLRSVRTAGAVVPASLRDDVRRLLGADVVVCWGMSEVGAGTFTGVADLGAEPASVGKPFGGAQVRVLGGELQFRGSSLFHGYLGDPEATTAAITGDGWLRTGDLARLEPDGSVTYLGRSSELINVGGRKLVAHEVEGLLAHLGRFAVVGRTDARLGEYPCLVVERPGVTLDDVTGVLRAAGLAEYKFPLEVITVDAIPLTPSGKISRRQLAGLVAAEAAEPAPGRTSTIRDPLSVVRACAGRVLGRSDPISPDTTFHDYGFDSAAAIRFGLELNRVTGRSLPTSVAFDHPTPLAVAGYLALDGPSALPRDFEQVYRLLTDTDPPAAAAVLRAAATLRSVFTAAEAVPPPAARLAGGSDSPTLICFPPILPMSAPTDYVDFAEALAGVHTVHAVENPGFTEGQQLPADAAALAAAHAKTVTELTADGRPYVLCGHSSGGWIAQLVAGHLDARPPLGVAMLDSPWPSTALFEEEMPGVLGIAVERERSLGVVAVGMTRLSATGGYLRVMETWRPSALPVPILYVSAAESPFGWSPSQPHTHVVVPGDHMTMVRPAATAVSEWLR
jgi:acyl-CoA synthetase (AMP-forming)/AMP-acid ligase II